LSTSVLTFALGYQWSGDRKDDSTPRTWDQRE
jgi:hypothetical protein